MTVINHSHSESSEIDHTALGKIVCLSLQAGLKGSFLESFVRNYATICEHEYDASRCEFGPFFPIGDDEYERLILYCMEAKAINLVGIVSTVKMMSKFGLHREPETDVSETPGRILQNSVGECAQVRHGRERNDRETKNIDNKDINVARNTNNVAHNANNADNNNFAVCDDDKNDRACHNATKIDQNGRSDRIHDHNDIVTEEYSEEEEEPIRVRLTMTDAQRIQEELLANEPKVVVEKRKSNLASLACNEDVLDMDKAFHQLIFKARDQTLFEGWANEFLRIMRKANEKNLLDPRIKNVENCEIYECIRDALEVSRKNVQVENSDLFRSIGNDVPSWKRLRHLVHERTLPLLEHLKANNPELIDTDELMAVVRARLYVMEDAPRKTEYRLLVPVKSSLTENTYDPNGIIRLGVYPMSAAYGTFQFQPHRATMELLDELEARQHHEGLDFILSPKKEPLSEAEWESIIRQDFLRIAGVALDTLALRILFLRDAKTKIGTCPIKRMKIIRSMGHTISEHVDFVITKSEQTVKRKCEDASLQRPQKKANVMCDKSHDSVVAGDLL